MQKPSVIRSHLKGENDVNNNWTYIYTTIKERKESAHYISLMKKKNNSV